MKTLQAGDLAPQFTLLNQDNQPVSLNDFKGKKVLVYFYPKALTPGCTTQACGLRDAKSELEKLGVVILGISTDSPKNWLNLLRKSRSISPCFLMKITRLLSNLAYGEKRNSWAVFMMVFTVLPFSLMSKAKFSTFLINSKTGEHHQVVLDYLQSR